MRAGDVCLMDMAEPNLTRHSHHRRGIGQRDGRRGGRPGATAGSAFGRDIFINGANTITFSPGSSNTYTRTRSPMRPAMGVTPPTGARSR
jgi:hypothetical protein